MSPIGGSLVQPDAHVAYPHQNATMHSTPNSIFMQGGSGATLSLKSGDFGQLAHYMQDRSYRITGPKETTTPLAQMTLSALQIVSCALTGSILALARTVMRP